MSLLPFLKNKHKKDASVIVQERAPDSPEEPSENEGLEAAAQDILSAISSNDAKSLAMALRAAFEICDSLPHVEGPHLEEEES